MTDSLQRMPRYLRDTGTGWEGANHQSGPWWPIPAPQAFSALWEQQPTRAEPTTYSDRLALAVCASFLPSGGPCAPGAICGECRQQATYVARELAQILRERYRGSSAIADWLDGVGCHD